MTDEEWERFVKWWKKQWLSFPDRASVEGYLQWKRDQPAVLNRQWQGEREVIDETTTAKD